MKHFGIHGRKDVKMHKIVSYVIVGILNITTLVKRNKLNLFFESLFKSNVHEQKCGSLCVIITS